MNAMLVAIERLGQAELAPFELRNDSFELFKRLLEISLFRFRGFFLGHEKADVGLGFCGEGSALPPTLTFVLFFNRIDGAGDISLCQAC